MVSADHRPRPTGAEDGTTEGELLPCVCPVPAFVGVRAAVRLHLTAEARSTSPGGTGQASPGMAGVELCPQAPGPGAEKERQRLKVKDPRPHLRAVQRDTEDAEPLGGAGQWTGAGGNQGRNVFL